MSFNLSAHKKIRLKCENKSERRRRKRVDVEYVDENREIETTEKAKKIIQISFSLKAIDEKL